MAESAKERTPQTILLFPDILWTHHARNKVSGDSKFFISCSPSGQKTVNSLIGLAQVSYTDGVYKHFEVLHLVISGNLQGKYTYHKGTWLGQEDYLKKCSSVLGYSHILGKSRVTLIADKLDLNIFLNPGGAFELFKKSATTICKSKSFIV